MTVDGLVRIRPLAEDDRDGLRAFNTRLSDQSLYRRFFYLSHRAADGYVEKLLHTFDPDHYALVAILDGDVVGVASFERVDATTAEIAVLIDDRDQHVGIGTRLLEQLAGVACGLGIHRFTADVLTDNSPMIRMLRRLGFSTATQAEGYSLVMSVGLESTGFVRRRRCDSGLRTLQ